MRIKILLTIAVLWSTMVFGQEGIAPLQRNQKLYQKTQSENPQLKTEDVGEATYRFIFDTLDLPVIDDFSKNYFMSYEYDTLSTANDTQIWVRYLSNGQYFDRLEVMFDTSYTYQFNGVGFDSTANPELIVVQYSPVDYQLPIDTDTVWIRPDTIFVGSTIITNHSPDFTYFNSYDSVIVIPVDPGAIWRNNNALHNYTYGDDPITMGVATFDGLDSTGVPYDPTMNPNSYQVADILETLPINLGPYNFITGDTAIYLSFFYQPQGLGDAPEPEDSLVLQFYTIQGNWNTVWSTEGKMNQPFRSAVVHLNSDIYLHNAFKFRFLNYASVSGNFDHWHIDYVILDELRTATDTTQDDVGLINGGQSLIKDYSQMPWSHYKGSTENLMKDQKDVVFRNIFSNNKFISESGIIAYENGSPIFQETGGVTPNLPPFAVGSETVTITNAFPKTDTSRIKSFHVDYYQETQPDDLSDNDTAHFHQQFGTQYAYDDGSAESAYFVTGAGAEIAVEYDIKVKDTLRSINIYFPRSYENIVDRSFRIVVWKSLNPEEVLYESFLYFPQYSGSRDYIVGFDLEEPLEVEGTIYVGIKQLDKRIYIGLDRNNDNQFKNYYNVGGKWSNSSYQGSLFIRPEFGETNPWPVSVEETQTEVLDFNMYPNPASSEVNLQMDGFENQVVIRSILGNVVDQFTCGSFYTFDTSHLPTGLYLVEVTDSFSGASQVKKLLIQN